MMTNLGTGSTALIVEGGALRGIFAAGVLDVFMAAGFNPFDLCIGVSAGSGVIASYLSKCPGRMRRVFTDYSRRPEFISIPRFLSGGHLLDLDWLWEITLRELPLDYSAIFQPGRRFLVPVTSVASGQGLCKQARADNLIDLIKASCAIPILYRAYPKIDGERMADGGIAEPIPIRQAIDSGASRVVVVRSQPRVYLKKSGFSGGVLARYMLRHQPSLHRALALRATRYNEAVSLIRTPHSQVEVIEVCPPADFTVGRLCGSLRQLESGYDMGLWAGDSLLRAWRVSPDLIPQEMK